MQRPGWGVQAAIFVALVVNLWVGGDLVEAWLGHAVRNLFELVLICAWLVLVIGMRAPLPFRGSGAPPAPVRGRRRAALLTPRSGRA